MEVPAGLHCHKASCHDFNMARAAVETGCVDRVLPLGQIAGVMVELVGK
jgi:chemotaxis response regulator CheB